MICDTVLRMDGAAGPSGLDAASWKRLCTSFKGASTDLCESLAATARRICTCYVDPRGLSAFVAYRLIALDKSPGISPIGIGETARRLIGRAIARVLSDDIQAAAAGSTPAVCWPPIRLQVCCLCHASSVWILGDRGSHSSWCDKCIQLSKPTAALRNFHHLCPLLSKILINTNREDVRLFIDGETLLSQEGTTQRDPLAMAMYAIAVNPLIHQLKHDTTKQIWFADDATTGGKLNKLREWWDCLTNDGPDYGYFPNASKTWLIVKEGYKDEVVSTFEGTQVVITVEGQKYHRISHRKADVRRQLCATESRHLGWPAGTILINSHHSTTCSVCCLHSLSDKQMDFLARTTPNINDLIKPLEEPIRKVFLPNLTG